MTSRDAAISFLILVVTVAGVLVFVGDPRSSDLRAVWLAGRFFETGDPGLIYRLSDGVFTMQPPDAWADRLRAEGVETSVFPFIYPPLWAWAAAALSRVADFDAVALWAMRANFAMAAGCFFLAWRIVGRPGPFWPWMLIGGAIMVTTLTFLLAIEENQPQILVSFLILLGIERTRAGHPVAGGAAMALAAALKLYPVVFALLWLAAGERRAVASFAAVGGTLGLLSLAVAGWPMHAAMLGELRAISATALVSLANFSMDPLWAALTIEESQLSRFDTSATGGDAFWWVIAKSPAWRTAGMVVQIATLAGLLWLARRTGMRAALLWPAAIIVVAWVSPLSWTYHYIPAFAFLPALVWRLGPAAGVAAIAAVLVHVFYPAISFGGMLSALGARNTVLLGNAELLFAAALFAILARRDLRR